MLMVMGKALVMVIATLTKTIQSMMVLRKSVTDKPMIAWGQFYNQLNFPKMKRMATKMALKRLCG